jgi:hypothetical protein
MSYDYSVQYVAESQTFPCLAAATAMMLSYQGGQAYSQSALVDKLTDAGVNVNDANDVDRLAYPLSLNLLGDITCRAAADWLDPLAYGPIMVGNSERVFLLAGIQNENDGDSAQVKIVDPGQGGETWMGYDEAKQRYHLDPDSGYQLKLLQRPS